MGTINIGQSVRLQSRISGFAAVILRNKQRSLGTHQQLASEAEVIELALALLEVCDTDAKIDRARTLLWNQLTRSVQKVNVTELQNQMARYKNPRGRRTDKPPAFPK